MNTLIRNCIKVKQLLTLLNNRIHLHYLNHLNNKKHRAKMEIIFISHKIMILMLNHKQSKILMIIKYNRIHRYLKINNNNNKRPSKSQNQLYNKIFCIKMN